MSDERDSNLLSSIIIVLMVILLGIGQISILVTIIQDNSITSTELLFFGSISIVGVVGLIYVFKQKKEMREKETFRREKW